MYYLGVDVGGTNIAVGVVNENYEIVAHHSVPTGASRPAEEVIRDMGDAVEAVLAAIYVDGGYEAVREVIFRLFRDEDKLVAPKVKDDKSALQEYTQAHELGLPAYRIIDTTGPDHDRQFVAEVLICGRRAATGQGTSKKSAEQMAARAALKRCQDEE